MKIEPDGFLSRHDQFQPSAGEHKIIKTGVEGRSLFISNIASQLRAEQLIISV